MGLYTCLWVSMSTYRCFWIYRCLWGFMGFWVSMGILGGMSVYGYYIEKLKILPIFSFKNLRRF